MRPPVHRLAAWLAFTVLFILTAAGGSDAADLRARPSIRLGQGWDSNIFNTIGNEVSDFYFTATPELLLSASTETFSLQLTGGLEGRWYYDNPEISSWNYSEYLRLSSPGGWKVTDRLTVTPGGYYLRSSNQYQLSLLVPSDPSLPSPTVATYGLQKVENFGASIGLNYLVTPRVEMGGTAYFAEQRYPASIVASDSLTYGANASVRYRFGPLSSLGGYVAANSADYEVTPDSQVLAFGLLGGYSFLQRYKLDGRFGVSYARREASPVTPSQTTQAPAGTISLGYTGETFQANLYLNVGYSALGGTGQLTRQGTAGIGISDRFTDRWSWHLGGTYQISRTVFEVTDIDYSSLNGSAGIRYAPWDWGSFDLTGYTTRQWSDLPGSDLNRYSAILGFTLGKSYTEF